MKLYFIPILILPFLMSIATGDVPSSPTAASHRNVMECVVAVVNDSLITQSDLQNKIRRELYLMEIIPQKTFLPMKDQFLQDLIGEEILVQRAKQLNITPPFEIVSSSTDQFINDVRFLFDEQDSFYHHIDALYGNLLEFRKLAQKWEERDFLINAVVAENISITDQEIKDFAESLKQKGEPAVKYRLSHIFRKFPENATEEKKREVEELTLDILSQIQAGEEFSRMVEKYSEDKATKRKGGSLGIVNQGQFAQPLEDAAEKLRKGEISLPVRSESGVHLLRLDDKIETRDLLFQKKFQEIKKEMIEELKQKASIRILDPLERGAHQFSD
ncbi:peptidylprolyl isomerase [Candidatus Sumerlaeota bacterium]|nr:peptidylprolyl isomerase [Candidatus Sumerlaeota bacterium]